MGHFIFVVFHFVAIIFLGGSLLLLTVPLHLIYYAVKRNNPNRVPQPNPRTHVRCPDCQELVLKEARKCKHCGTALTPAP